MEMFARALINERYFYLMVMLVAVAEGSEFLEEPSSVNASEGSIASFTCATFANTTAQQTWLVNWKTLNDVDNIGRGIQTLDNGSTYFMTVPATAGNDGVTIRCVLKKGLVSTHSQQAELKVQGLLSVVSGISTKQVDNTTITLSFTAPPTLLGVPINHYFITISSSDAHINDSLITNSTTIALHLPDACIKYWITISAWNNVGEGESYNFSVILAAIPNRPTAILNQRYVSDMQLETVLTAMGNVECLGTNPETFDIELSASSDSESIIHVGPCSLSNSSNTSCLKFTSYSEGGHLRIALNLSDYLQQNENYKGNIGMYNTAGSARTSIQISTFDTSYATIIMYKDSYCVLCEFVEGSKCQGCKIVITDAKTATPLATLAVPRFNDASSVTQCLNTIQLPSGEYMASISDIESDGSYSETAITLMFSLNNSKQSSTGTSPTTMADESMSPVSVTLVLLTILGAICVFTLATILVLVSCLLHLRTKRKQKSEDTQQKLELQFSNPDPTYDNAQEILMVERERAKNIQTEPCVAYASVSQKQ